MINRGKREGRGSRGETERDFVKSRVIWRTETQEWFMEINVNDSCK